MNQLNWEAITPAESSSRGILRDALRRRLCALATAVVWAFACDATLAALPDFELTSLLAENGGDGRDGFAIIPLEDEDFLGSVVNDLADINNDGHDDLIVTATRPGHVYVIFGRPGGFPAEFEVAGLLVANGGDGTTGFVIVPDENPSGGPTSTAGDLNGDGIEDLATAGSPGVYVIYGTDEPFAAEMGVSSRADGQRGFLIQEPESGVLFGSVIAAAGDVNGDGIDDLVISAKNASPGGRFLAGQVYVVFGSELGFPAVFEASGLLAANGGDGSTGFVLNGIDPIDEAGFSIAGAGDLNADGIHDLIVGMEDSLSQGEAYIVFGSDQPFPAEFELSALMAVNGGDGSDGFILFNGGPGWSVDGGGDFNGDGIDDVVLGGPRAGVTQGGAYVWYGTTAPTAPEVNLFSVFAGSPGFGMSGSGEMSAGYAVANAGDVNNDGIDDVVVGAPGPLIPSDGGNAFIVFGNSAHSGHVVLADLAAGNGGTGSHGYQIIPVPRDDFFRCLGCDVSTAGDINGDGIDDVVIGEASLGGFVGAIAWGAAYVIFGDTDSDGDQVLDRRDNCTELPNPSQSDTNGDGIGNVCDADIGGIGGPGDDDCAVNFADLNILRAAFFSTPADTTWNEDADFTGVAGEPDGIVNFADMQRMKELFFGPPGPSANGCTP